MVPQAGRSSRRSAAVSLLRDPKPPGPAVTRRRAAHRHVSAGFIFPPDVPQREGPNSVTVHQGQQTTSGVFSEKPAHRPVGETGLVADALSWPPRPRVVRKTTIGFRSTSTCTLSPLLISWEQDCGLGSVAPASTPALGWGRAPNSTGTARRHHASRDSRQPCPGAGGLRGAPEKPSWQN